MYAALVRPRATVRVVVPAAVPVMTTYAFFTTVFAGRVQTEMSPVRAAPRATTCALDHVYEWTVVLTFPWVSAVMVALVRTELPTWRWAPSCTTTVAVAPVLATAAELSANTAMGAATAPLSPTTAALGRVNAAVTE